MTMTSSLI